MPTNDFLPFATAGGANVMLQADYAALAARSAGFTAGVAQSIQVNKALRQAAFIAACVAQFTSTNSNQNTLDDGDVNGFVAKMLTAWQNVGRIRLMAPLNIYVATTGSDTTNTGLSVGSPLATLQAAVTLVMTRYDLNNQQVTINVANGTYTGVTTWGPWVGQVSPRINFVGNVGSPGSVVINNGPQSAAFSSLSGAYISVSGFTVTASGTAGAYTQAGMGLNAAFGGQIVFDHMVFGACSFAHIVADQGAQITSLGTPYTISGGGQYHAFGARGGGITVVNSALTLTATPAFSVGFANAVLAYLDFGGCTFSGTATGPRYVAAANGVINTNGGGASFLPGSTTGSTASGGQYT